MRERAGKPVLVFLLYNPPPQEIRWLRFLSLPGAHGVRYFSIHSFLVVCRCSSLLKPILEYIFHSALQRAPPLLSWTPVQPPSRQFPSQPERNAVRFGLYFFKEISFCSLVQLLDLWQVNNFPRSGTDYYCTSIGKYTPLPKLFIVRNY